MPASKYCSPDEIWPCKSLRHFTCYDTADTRAQVSSSSAASPGSNPRERLEDLKEGFEEGRLARCCFRNQNSFLRGLGRLGMLLSSLESGDWPGTLWLSSQPPRPGRTQSWWWRGWSAGTPWQDQLHLELRDGEVSQPVFPTSDLDARGGTAL